MTYEPHQMPSGHAGYFCTRHEIAFEPTGTCAGCITEHDAERARPPGLIPPPYWRRVQWPQANGTMITWVCQHHTGMYDALGDDSQACRQCLIEDGLLRG